MGFFSAIGSAFSSVCSAIGGVLGSIAGALGTVVPMISATLQTVGAIFQALARILAVFNQDETVEDMGDRALQAGEAGIKPENFDTFDEYMAEIRNFELDPEKSKQYSSEEKTLAGMAVASKGIEEKFDLAGGTMVGLAGLMVANSDYFNADRLGSWLQQGGDIGKVIDYFSGKTNMSDSIEANQTVVEWETKESGKSEAEVKAEIYEARHSVNSQD